VRKPLLMVATERLSAAKAASAVLAAEAGQQAVSGFRSSRLPFVDSESVDPKSAPPARRYVGGIR
jgi:hypothetical protein